MVTCNKCVTKKNPTKAFRDTHARSHVLCWLTSVKLTLSNYGQVGNSLAAASGYANVVQCCLAVARNSNFSSWKWNPGLPVHWFPPTVPQALMPIGTWLLVFLSTLRHLRCKSFVSFVIIICWASLITFKHCALVIEVEIKIRGFTWNFLLLILNLCDSTVNPVSLSTLISSDCHQISQVCY